MAVLVQEIICADYAFVIHTKNPLSGDTSEIYTEVCLAFWILNQSSGMYFILLCCCKTDCEGPGRDFGGCISWTRHELHYQEDQSNVSYCMVNLPLFPSLCSICLHKLFISEIDFSLNYCKPIKFIYKMDII